MGLRVACCKIRTSYFMQAGQAPVRCCRALKGLSCTWACFPAEVAGCRMDACVRLCKSRLHALGRGCTRLRTVQTGCAGSCRAARNAAGSSRRRQRSRQLNWLGCGRTCDMSRGGAAVIWPTQQVIYIVIAEPAGGVALSPPLAWAAPCSQRRVIQDAAAQGCSSQELKLTQAAEGCRAGQMSSLTALSRCFPLWVAGRWQQSLAGSGPMHSCSSLAAP